MNPPEAASTGRHGVQYDSNFNADLSAMLTMDRDTNTSPCLVFIHYSSKRPKSISHPNAKPRGDMSRKLTKIAHSLHIFESTRVGASKNLSQKRINSDMAGKDGVGKNK
jgi:hypothetical protein